MERVLFTVTTNKGVETGQDDSSALASCDGLQMFSVQVTICVWSSVEVAGNH